MAKKTQPQKNSARPPIVVVMGHIDHGKSTLLDYIRKTNVVESESGGITQHLSAYEVTHSDEKGTERSITFLDTPGHEAFQKMRLHGAEVADIAILIVSAEEGAKAQTLEAYTSIKEAGLPYIVAINKIDRPNANVERTKQNLLEHEIYLEGLGGDIPWVAISAKEGTGVSELLDMLLLVADLEELTGNPDTQATGIVIEAHRDPRKGISATLVIKNGTLKSGMFVASGGAYSPVRIFEDFQGKSIKEASLGSPVQVVGWNELPHTGAGFTTFDTKKEAERAVVSDEKKAPPIDITNEEAEKTIFPIILKADVLGSMDAILHELKKLETENATVKIVHSGVGSINESDVKTAIGLDGVVVVGFHCDVDKAAADLADRSDVSVQTFDIIYKLSEWAQEELARRTPEDNTPEVLGAAKILKCFSKTKNKQVIGGRVEFGSIKVKQAFRIMRNETEIGEGVIKNLQQQKADANEVSEGNEFGAELNSAIEITEGDIIEIFGK